MTVKSPPSTIGFSERPEQYTKTAWQFAVPEEKRPRCHVGVNDAPSRYCKDLPYAGKKDHLTQDTKNGENSKKFAERRDDRLIHYFECMSTPVEHGYWFWMARENE